MEEQVCVIYAGVNGYCDPMPIEKIKPFEEALLLDLRNQHADILDEIRDSKDLSDATGAKLKGVVERVAKQFT